MQTQLNVAIDVGSVMHRVAIGLGTGAAIDEFDCPHTPVGIGQFFTRVRHHKEKHGATVSVAMEGFGGYARPLDNQILAQGWQLYAINNLKFARFKEIFPAPAKTDAIDAKRMLQLMQVREDQPVARAVLQEVAPIDDTHQQLKALTRRRKLMVEERTEVSLRMQAELLAVAPGLLAITGRADNLWFLNFLTCRADLRKLATVRHSTLLQIEGIGVKFAAQIARWQESATFAPSVEWAGVMILEDAKRMLALRDRIDALDRQIAGVAEQSAIAKRLQSMPGFGVITASEVASEIGNIDRFRNEASLAVYLGVAPLDKSSGKRTSAKLPRQVNPRARNALLIATIQHMRQVPESRAFYDRKREQGKSHMQATRALARHLVRVIFTMIKNDRDYRINAPKTSEKA